MRKIKNAIFTIIHPSFWVMNSQYSKIWDEALISIMKENKNISNFTSHTVTISGIEIWTANYPYAAYVFRGLDVRASRLTIYEFHSWLVKKKIEKCLKDAEKTKTNPKKK